MGLLKRLFGNGKNAGVSRDQLVLGALKGAGANLDLPRDVEHFLYLPSEASAKEVAERVKAEGYEVDVHEADRGQWALVANRVELANAEAVRDRRALFESLAQQSQGEYDGWEAAAVP